MAVGEGGGSRGARVGAEDARARPLTSRQVRRNICSMTRTQVQLPDRLHRRLKAVAEHEETSLAEVIRRAGECFLAVHPELDEAPLAWSLPTAADMGRLLAPESHWRVLANEPPEAELLARLR